MAPAVADEVGAVTVGALDPKGTLAAPVLKEKPVSTGVVMAFRLLTLVIVTPRAGAI